MIDKEKIKQEIESYKESMKGLEPHSDFRRGQLTACNQIMQFIDSLPEEPKKQPKYKVGDIIKGPHNNIFEIKEVLENQYVLHSKNGDELNSITIVDRSSCVVEEPASEDLDFLVISLEETIGTSPHSREVIKEYLQKAAEWGRNHFEDKSEKVSEDLEKDYSFEKILQEIYIKYDKKISIESLLDIASYFVEWQKQKDQETIELAEDHAMLAGMNKMKEEMMENAVDAVVYQGLYSKYVKESDDEALANVLKNHNSGDKVKIIIVKTEQQ